MRQGGLTLVRRAAGEVGDALLELLDGLVEVLVGGLGVGEERLEQVAKLLWIAQIRYHVQLPALIEPRFTGVEKGNSSSYGEAGDANPGDVAEFQAGLSP